MDNNKRKKFYLAQGRRIGDLQIKRILGDPPCITDARMALVNRTWKELIQIREDKVKEA